MSERLIIRLSSKKSGKNYWLIWSDSENEIIASGELENAEQLNLLTEKAQQRTVVCLVPGSDVAIREIAINGNFNRQMQQALPYLVEDEIASDVELLHFAVVAKQKDLIHVAICEKQKMVMWLDWLAEAQIPCRQFIPEGLTLPVSEQGHWQAVKLGCQWIVRENQNIAWSCDQQMLDIIVASKLAENETVTIESFSASAGNKAGTWVDLPSVLPIELLAKGAGNNKINLLIGEFKPQKEQNLILAKWRIPAIFAALLFVVLVVNRYRENVQIENQTLQVKQRVEAVYQQAFPLQSKLRYARIKKKIKSMLVGLEGNIDSGFLSMLNDLVPALTNNPQFTITNIKFDNKKQEIRISANTDNFQSFEKVNAELTSYFSVEQGALSSTKGRVSGLLTIRNK